jgi:hypothetical protein
MEISMRVLLGTMAVLFFIQFASSQTHNFYIGGGYNYPTSSSLIGQEYYSETKKIYGSFAEGYNFYGGYSMFIGDNLGFDLVYFHLIGFRYKRYEIIQSAFFSEFDNSSSIVIPSLILKTSIGNFIPYMKFGLSINWITLKIRKTSASLYIPKIEHKYEGNNLVGISTAIGVNYILFQNLYLFTDLHLNSITFFPTKYSYYEDGKLVQSRDINMETSFPFSALDLSFGIKLEL